MAVFLIVCVGLVWLGVVVLLFFRAIEAAMEGTRSAAVTRFAIAIVFLAASIAIGVAMDGDDPHANQLCLNGHERWVTQHSRSGDYQVKEWVCSTWE